MRHELTSQHHHRIQPVLVNSLRSHLSSIIDELHPRMLLQPTMPAVSKFLADLWKKIKRDSSVPTMDISENDIVVLCVQQSSRLPSILDDEPLNSVVGPTGSGKSWVRAVLPPSHIPSFISAPSPSQFTNTATKCDLVKVSRDQHPFTGNVQAIRCELTDEAKRDLQGVTNIVFVDTPSFLTGYDHPDPHKEFRVWFNQIA